MVIKAVSKKENAMLMYGYIKQVSEIIETARVAEVDGIEVKMHDDFKHALRLLNELAFELRVARGGKELELDAMVPGERLVRLRPEDIKEMGSRYDE